MKRICILAVCLLSLFACSKEQQKYEKIEKLCSKTWYAKTGETYTFEDFLTIGDSQISVGTKTVDLLSRFSFRENGTGTRHVYYQKVFGDLFNYMSYDYADFQFTWTNKDGVLTVTNATSDPNIPSSVEIEPLFFWDESWQGYYNGQSRTFYTDRTRIEK